jgi:hypothetical protein
MGISEMRGRCSIQTCQNQSKINEYFENVNDINICWSCGDKILKGLAKEDIRWHLYIDYEYEQ